MSGDIRPIVFGYTWMRRLAAKCAARDACEILKAFLSPSQADIDVSGACKAIFHAARSFIANKSADLVVVNLDISNACSSLHRDYMLRCVTEKILDICKFCYSSYKVYSTLQLGEFTILSPVGPQQDDPLIGLLFCLGINPTKQSTHSIRNKLLDFNDLLVEESLDVIVITEIWLNDSVPNSLVLGSSSSA